MCEPLLTQVKTIVKMIEINGNQIKGGGQVLRISLALSALHNKPVHLVNILREDSRTGMGAQHMIGVKLMKEIAQADVEGDSLFSTEVKFMPKGIKSGTYIADTKTAGSISLLLQVSLPSILFGSDEIHLTLKGGTNVIRAPQIDYVINVFRPLLEKFGATFDCNIIRRGFFPAGQGHVEISVKPVKELKPIDLTEFGEIKYIKGVAYVAGVLPIRIAKDMARAAENLLRESIDADIRIECKKFNQHEAFRNGSGINLVAVTTTGCYLGGSNLGERNVSNEEIGQKAAEELLKCLKRKICVDENAQDQLIIFMSLANGKSRIKTGPITSHTEKAITVTELFNTAKFNVISLDDYCNIIECERL